MGDSKDSLQEWLVNVISGLVQHEDDIKILRKEDEMGVLYTVGVNPEDAGKIIGKKGQHADALRLLLRCAGSKGNQRVSMKIDMPNSNF